MIDKDFDDVDQEDHDQIALSSAEDQELSVNYFYSSDSDNDFSEGDTIGNIPREWYEHYPHLGYNLSGTPISKSSTDTLDKFINRGSVTLTKEELDTIESMMNGKETYEPLSEIFVNDVMQTPINATPEPKRRFIPSKHEGRMIEILCRKIRSGELRKKVVREKKYYDIWENEEPVSDKLRIVAPKMKLPGHEESYNPPEEYLPDEEELKKLEEEEDDIEEREYKIKPVKYDSFREIKAYDNFVNERFSRCLDLYLCPRSVRKIYDLNSLLPSVESYKYKHVYTFKQENVKSISCNGEYMVTVGKEVRMWEVLSGKLVREWMVDGTVVEWNKKMDCFALVVGNEVWLISPSTSKEELNIPIENTSSDGIKWVKPTFEQKSQGILLIIQCPAAITSISFHKKGSYLATSSSSVHIHNLARMSSQLLTKSTGLVKFYDNFIYIAGKTMIIVNLMTKDTKKVHKWISSIDAGNIVAFCDKKLYIDGVVAFDAEVVSVNGYYVAAGGDKVGVFKERVPIGIIDEKVKCLSWCKKWVLCGVDEGVKMYS